MSTKHCKDIKMQIAMALSSKSKCHKYLWLGTISPHLSPKHLWDVAMSKSRFKIVNNAQRYTLTFIKPYYSIKRSLLDSWASIKYHMQNAIVGNACVLCTPSFSLLILSLYVDYNMKGTGNVYFTVFFNSDMVKLS